MEKATFHLLGLSVFVVLRTGLSGWANGPEFKIPLQATYSLTMLRISLLSMGGITGLPFVYVLAIHTF